MTNRPRVLHVSQPVEAGVPAVVLGLLEAQQQEGWAPMLACPPEGSLPDKATAMGVEVHEWRAGRSPGRSTAGEARSLAAIVARAAPDVVHLHSSKAGLAGRLAVRGSRPTVYQPHAWSFNAVDGVVGRLSLMWERLAARWVHLLVCVSDDELAAGRAIGIGSRAAVIPNGVDTDRWQPGDRTSGRARLGLPPERPLVVCVGRLTEQKGQDLLLAAWPQVLDRRPDAVLALVGDGPGATQWRNTDRFPRTEGVIWAGSADPGPWYEAADVVVLPSRWEGMALVPLEAMACGRPVVGFAVAGVKESVGDAGAVVVPGDLDGLAAALITRLTDPERATAEGLAGRRRVVERFDVRTSHRRVCAETAALMSPCTDAPHPR